MKYYILFFTVLITVAGCTSQKSFTNSPFNNMVQERAYTFVATQAIPTEDARYNTRLMFPNGANLYQLTSRYDVRVTPDSVIAYLPFFGRSFTAPLDPSKGGIKFTSVKFDYKQSMRKGNYEIEITPNDTQEVRNLFLSISPGGYASLRVLSNNKTPISFNGNIEANK